MTTSKSWLKDPLDIFNVKDTIELLDKSDAEFMLLDIQGKMFKIQRDGFSLFDSTEPAYRIDPVEGFIPCGRFTQQQLTDLLEGMG